MTEFLVESCQHLKDLAPHVKGRKTPQLLSQAVAEIERLQGALCELLYAAEDFLASPDPRKPLPRSLMPLGQPTTVADCQRLTRAWKYAECLVGYDEWVKKQTAEAGSEVSDEVSTP